MTMRMEHKSKLRAILAAAVAIPALAATACAPASAQAPQMPQAMHGGPGVQGRADHVEGRIAYLKAELKITEAQAQAWNGVAAAMRRNAESDRAVRDEMRGRRDKPMTAVEYLALRDRTSAVRAENSKAFTTAFTTLYAQLSDDQKKAADQLLSPRRHRRA